MTVLAMFFAGHFIGDWIVQTDWQAANKMHSWKANQQHMLGYHVTLAMLSFLAGLRLSIVFVVFVSWITHSIIDRRWPVVWLMQHSGSRVFSTTTFGVIAVDQALHLSILCGLATLYR